ncbi:MAG: hypothetical protein ACKV0T_31710 [Planctomycetales bacterium]
MSFGHRVLFGRRLPYSRGIWGCVLLGVVVSGAWAIHAADDAPATGLRGVLPVGVPVDVTTAISALPPTWETWGTELTNDLVALYEQEGLDVAGQKKAMEALEGRLKTVKKSLADARYKSITNALVSLQGSLQRRLDLAKATLETLEMGPQARTARVDAARQNLAKASSSLRSYLGSIKGGDGWIKYLQVSEAAQQPIEGGVTLATVQTRLKGKVEQADEKVRNFMERPEIVAYEKALDSYLKVANSSAPAATNSPELRAKLGELLAGIDDYELSQTTAAATSVRKAFDGVRGLAADGGQRLEQVLRTHYLNYNLRVVATEAFLSRLVGERRTENGPVTDFILGANVSGSQSTVTDVSVNLIPSANKAQFDITANGAISSSTVGVTDQANVWTQGNHYFTAAKRILFDGDKFWTEAARINVNANNTTTGAATSYSGMPLLGPFADRIAVREAEKLRGESEAIAASRVRDNVLPRFNSQIDENFGAKSKMNGDVAARIAALKELNLYPDAKSYSTTETELRVSTRLMGGTELGGGDPNPALILGRGVTILVHESLLNNSADRMGLQGQTLTDDQLREKIEQQLTKLLGREVKFNNDKPVDSDEAAKSLIFHNSDPIRFEASGGELVVTLRAGLKQEGKEEIPTQIIRIPLTISVDQKNVVIEPAGVSVSSLDAAANAAEQGVRAGVIKKKIEASFPRREIDRVSYLERAGHKTLVAVTRVKALDGWLSITFE